MTWWDFSVTTTDSEHQFSVDGQHGTSQCADAVEVLMRARDPACSFHEYTYYTVTGQFLRDALSPIAGADIPTSIAGDPVRRGVPLKTAIDELDPTKDYVVSWGTV